MSKNIFLVWILFFVLAFLTDWLLKIMNINQVLKNRENPPKNLAGLFDAARHARSVDYTLRKEQFGLFTAVQSRVIVLAVLLTQSTGRLEILVRSWTSVPYWQGLIFLGMAFVALALLEVPSSLYLRFVIEEEFEFNTVGLKTFLTDSLKGFVVTVILLMGLLGGLYAARVWSGSFWWLSAWIFMTVFQLLITVLYPVLIAPMFNKFEPLADGSLKTKLENMAQRCKFPVQGIYTMDGSRRSKHSNAYFTGLGRFRRIVIFDTLIECLSEDELEAVLAHEIGHWKYGHIRRRLLVSLALSLVLFFAASLVLDWKALYMAFGFSQSSLHGLIFLVSFFTGPIKFFCSPLTKASSRRQEYQADAYALEQTGKTQAMEKALLALGQDNLSNLTPHPAYSFWHYSHPALTERLAALSENEN